MENTTLLLGAKLAVHEKVRSSLHQLKWQQEVSNIVENSQRHQCNSHINNNQPSSHHYTFCFYIVLSKNQQGESTNIWCFSNLP